MSEPRIDTRYSCRLGCWIAEMTREGIVLVSATGATRREALDNLQRARRAARQAGPVRQDRE